MATLDQRILNLIKNYMGKLIQKKVLTSMEEVEANTNETNLVAAPVVAALNNKLAGCSFEAKEDGAYIKYTLPGGADPVVKKLGNGDMDITITCVHSVHLHNSSYKLDIDIPLSRSTYQIAVRDGRATFSGGYANSTFTGYAAVPGSSNTITLNATSITVDVKPL